MALRKMTDAEKQAVIDANVGLIPAASKELFYTKDLDSQYVKMKEYMRNEAKKNGTFVNTKKPALNISDPLKAIKSYCRRKDVSFDKLEQVKSYIDTYIVSNKEKKIADIDKKIAELLKEKEAFTK